MATFHDDVRLPQTSSLISRPFDWPWFGEFLVISPRHMDEGVIEGGIDVGNTSEPVGLDWRKSNLHWEIYGGLDIIGNLESKPPWKSWMYNLPAGITNSWRNWLSSTSNLWDALSFKGRAKGPKTISPSRTCGLGKNQPRSGGAMEPPGPWMPWML